MFLRIFFFFSRQTTMIVLKICPLFDWDIDNGTMTNWPMQEIFKNPSFRGECFVV
jgi:hypothetical protein